MKTCQPVPIDCKYSISKLSCSGKVAEIVLPVVILIPLSWLACFFCGFYIYKRRLEKSEAAKKYADPAPSAIDHSSVSSIEVSAVKQYHERHPDSAAKIDIID